jgi:hypothetical protein
MWARPATYPLGIGTLPRGVAAKDEADLSPPDFTA